MWVRLLGPVELWGPTGQIDLGTPQQRCVFSVLAMTPRQSVAVETLLDRVWGEQLPRNARTVLYTYVSRLRGRLQQASAGTDHHRPILRRHSGGYALELPADRVDLHRVRQLASQARAAASGRGDGGRRRAEMLAQACQLWSGPALAGITGDWADRIRTGLEHERVALLTERFEAALQIGEHGSVIGPLSEAFAAHPFAESLAALLMLALHRGGRSAEALRVYAQLRRRMVDELGDEPGAALRRLHEQILRRDRSLNRPAGRPSTRASARGAAPGWVPMCQLPPDVWHFVGRDLLLKELSGLLAPTPGQTAVTVVSLTGGPGTGKTALATRLAHLAREHFPDGQWFVSLAGGAGGAGRDPGEVLGELLTAAGVDPSGRPDGLAQRATELRTRLADRRVLLVLDQATDPAQLRPLLPGTGSAAVLITSRRRLGGLDETAHARLDPLTHREAMELLGRLAGPDRVAAEPSFAEEVCAACGRLPLALRIAAARLASHPEWTLERFAGRLRDPRRRLDELAVDDLAVRPELAQTHLALDRSLQSALARLGRLGTDHFTAGTAAALAGVPDGERLVEGLVAACLLEPVDNDAAVEPRYRLPELVAAYASELPD